MQNSRKLAFVAVAAMLAVASIPTYSHAADAPSQAQILERLAALERRVDSLAAENASLRQQLADKNRAGSPAASTATPAAAPKPDKPATVYAAAAGKEAKLSLGGFFNLNAEAGGVPDSRWTGINDRFFLRRARLNVAGSFEEDFSFKLEGDFGNNSLSSRSGYSAQLTDAYATWAPSELASVRIGQFKTLFGYEQLLSDTKNPTVERSLPSDRLTMSRQIGAGLFGDLVPKKFSYSVGIFNGNGVNNGNNDDDEFLYVGRLSGAVFESGEGPSLIRLDAGINAFTTDLPGSTTNRQGVGADLQLAWGPATVSSEWLRNSFDTTTAAGNFDAEGWSILAVWALDKRWQLMGRIETYDSNTSMPGTTTDSWTLGAGYLIKGDNLKLTFNYIRGEIDGAGSDGRLLGRLQVMY